MYIIGNVVYGISLTEEVGKAAEEWRPDGLGVLAKKGIVTTLYSGAVWHTVGYCGICLGRFDECDGDVLIKADEGEMEELFRFIVTDEQRAKASEKIAKLPDEIKAVMPKVGIHFVFSTSC